MDLEPVCFQIFRIADYDADVRWVQYVVTTDNESSAKSLEGVQVVMAGTQKRVTMQGGLRDLLRDLSQQSDRFALGQRDNARAQDIN